MTSLEILVCLDYGTTSKGFDPFAIMLLAQMYPTCIHYQYEQHKKRKYLEYFFER